MELVSVIIPCYKNRDTLDRAILSVLNQTYSSIEIIVVNDFPDETEVIKSIVKTHLNVRFFSNLENSGPSKTRNHGVQKSKGKIIAFLDADDEYHPKKIELQIKELKPNIAITCGLNKISLDGHTTSTGRKFTKISSPKSLIFRNKLNGAGLMCFKKLFLDIGGYNEDMKGNEDWDLWLRFLSRGEVIDIGKPLYLYHENSTGITSNKEYIGFWELMVVSHFYNRLKESEKNFFLRERIFLFRFFVLIFRRELTNSSSKNLIKQIQTNPHLCSLSKKILLILMKFRIFLLIKGLLAIKKIFYKRTIKRVTSQYSFLENQVTKYPMILRYKKPKLVAITGGTGFVGSELVKKCIAHGWHIRLLTRGNKSLPTSSQIEIFHGDLRNTIDWTEFIKNVDVIINCAGVIEDKKNINAVNVEGSLRLLNASIGKVKRWVQLSSAGVYGVPENKIINEKSILMPKTPYEISKANFDKILNDVAIENKLDFIILRPTIIFGSRMTNKSMFQLVSAVKRNIFFFIGKSGNWANYIHVNDVVNALMLSVVKPKHSENVYNISNKITIEKLIEIICKALYIPTPKIRLPLLIVKPFVLILGWLPFVTLTSSRLKALTSKTRYSTKLIEKNLGFKFEVPLQEGIYSFVRHFL